MSRQTHVLSWLIGLAGILFIVWFIKPDNLAESIRLVGIQGTITWFSVTLIARFLMVEITVAPLTVLGFHLLRRYAFWISWLRTLSNQIFPFLGIALFIQQVRKRTGIPISQLASLTTPQVFLSGLAVGIIGLIATTSNAEILGPAKLPLWLAFALLAGGMLWAPLGMPWLIDMLPQRLSSRANSAAASFRKLATHPNLLLKLLLLHLTLILIRGSRIWVLFAAVEIDLEWRQILLLIALAASTGLVRVTPGGLGLREGAIVGGAALLSLPLQIAATVAIIDRFFVLGLTALMAVPAAALLRDNTPVQK